MKLLDIQVKTNWKFIAIVVVLGLAVGGGVWWYKISLETESQVPQIITSQQIPTPTPAAETILGNKKTASMRSYSIFNSEFF